MKIIIGNPARWEATSTARGWTVHKLDRRGKPRPRQYTIIDYLFADLPCPDQAEYHARCEESRAHIGRAYKSMTKCAATLFQDSPRSTSPLTIRFDGENFILCPPPDFGEYYTLRNPTNTVPRTRPNNIVAFPASIAEGFLRAVYAKFGTLDQTISLDQAGKIIADLTAEMLADVRIGPAYTQAPSNPHSNVFQP